MHSASGNDDEQINELDLDEILAELDGISEEDDTEQMVDEDSLNEAEDDEADTEEEEEPEETEPVNCSFFPRPVAIQLVVKSKQWAM